MATSVNTTLREGERPEWRLGYTWLPRKMEELRPGEGDEPEPGRSAESPDAPRGSPDREQPRPEETKTNPARRRESHAGMGC